MSSRGVNKVILIGNLGQDPEVRHMPNGNAVANVSLATSESWKDKTTGEAKERTEWHRVVFFGKLAEIVAQYLKKGAKIYVEGKLQTRKWEKDGVDRYSTEVVVDGFQGVMQMLVDSKQGQGPAQAGSGAHSAPCQAPVHGSGPASQPDQQAHGGRGSGGDPNKPQKFDDDIPF